METNVAMIPSITNAADTCKLDFTEGGWEGGRKREREEGREGERGRGRE
jgi:hypothetical protein